jgi:hypothetical protein
MKGDKEDQELREKSLKDAEAKKAEVEIVSGEREVDIEGFGKVTIIHASLAVSQECEKLYSEKFIEYLNEGKLPTLIQLEKTLKERDIWGPEEDANLQKLTDDLVSASVQVNQSKADLETVDKKDRKKLEDKIASLERKRILAQSTLVNTNMSHNQLLESTVERRAEKDALFYKILRCTKDPEGNPLFKSKEDMLDKPYGFSLDRLAVACINFWGGIDDPLFEQQLEGILGS